MKKHTPSRLAPSKLIFPKRAPSKRAPSRLAPSSPAPSRRLPVLALVLVLAALLAAVGGTVAIYTSQAFQRGVVRNQDTTAIFFSSDKLYRVASGTDAQYYYYPMSSKEQNTMTFQVCNYDQNQNTAFNNQDIKYTIEFQVTNGTEGFEYNISDDNQDIKYTIEFQVTNGTEGFEYNISDGDTSQQVAKDGLSFTGFLEGGKRSANSYTFTFKGFTPDDTDNTAADYNKVELAVKVTPGEQYSAATRNKILNGVLIPVAYASTQGITVKSEFTDSTRGTPDAFDAYNLLVSISGGEGNVVISWDPKALDMDPFFKGTRAVNTLPNGYSSIKVSMNSENETGAYLIQFYNHNPQKPTWTAWSELPISVELEQPASSEEQLSQT